MSKLNFQQRGNQNTRIPISQRRTPNGTALEDNRTAFAAKQLKQDQTAQLSKEEHKQLKGKSGTKQLAKKDEKEIVQTKFSDREPPALREEQPDKPNNTGLPDKLKNGIESLSGLSMDNVKVHYNSAKPQQLNALAYAQRTDIHVGPGQEKHLPHEAWHVVQQAQGRVKPTMQMKGGVPINDVKSLEHEADVMGNMAVQQSKKMSASVRTSSPKFMRGTSQLKSTLLGQNPVVQKQLINSTGGTYQWWSSDGFDEKHLGPAPTTDQGWINLRNQRWPGFGRNIPGCTLITGDLNAALNANDYSNYVEANRRFTIVVNVQCTTIRARDVNNALTANNLMLVRFTRVKLGGYLHRNGYRYVIDHLERGVD